MNIIRFLIEHRQAISANSWLPAVSLSLHLTIDLDQVSANSLPLCSKAAVSMAVTHDSVGVGDTKALLWRSTKSKPRQIDSSS